MSGRLHLFFTPNNLQKLEELVQAAGVDKERLGVAHVCQVATEYLLEKFKYKTFTPEQETAIRKVPEPVNHGLHWMYLKQANVNRLMEMIKVYDIEWHDFALQHLVQLGVSLLYDDWKANAILPALFDRLKVVEQPKVVYHN